MALIFTESIPRPRVPLAHYMLYSIFHLLNICITSHSSNLQKHDPGALYYLKSRKERFYLV